MKFSSEEQQLKQMLEAIQTPEINDLHDKINQRLIQKPSIKKYHALKVSLATCLCLFLTIPIVSASPTLQELIYLVGFEIVLALQPINLVSEDNGIKLEVLGAMNDDEQVVIYLTLQDLNNDVLDETLDIYNYTLDGVSALNMQTIDYDEATKTATLRLQGNGGKHLNGKNVRFGIQSFLTGQTIYEDVSVDLDWDALLSTVPEIITLGDHDSSGGGGLIKMDDTDIQVLKPNQMELKIPGLDFVTITNIGYVDNRLHIQTKWLEDRIDDHGFFYFTDENNEKVEVLQGSISFGVNENNETEYGSIMEEYIFEITPEQLSSLNLKGDFYSNDTYTEGDWNVKFKLESTSESFTTKTQIPVGEGTVTEVSSSPLGITLTVDGEITFEDVKVKLLFKNGEMYPLESPTVMTVQDETTLKFFDIKYKNIEAIQINDTIIPLQ